jgi:1-acyl-sn-glycerol-3-phosphate acyltransferase
MKSKFFNIFIYTLLLIHSCIYFALLFFYLIPPMIFKTKKQNLYRLRYSIRLYGYMILKIALFPFVKIQYKNLSNYSKKEGIYIVNHRSSSDPFLMTFLNCDMIQVVSRWPFKIPVLGYFAKKAEYISVADMSQYDFEKETKRILDQNISIAAFPEGTRSGSKKMNQFTSAIFRTALKIKCPLFPVCITGNENIPTKNFVLNTGTIKMHKLPPILWDEYKDMSPFKLKNYIRNIIASEILKMEEA